MEVTEHAMTESFLRGLRILEERALIEPNAEKDGILPLGELSVLVDAIGTAAGIEEFYVYSEAARKQIRVSAFVLPRDEATDVISITPNKLRLFEVESHGRAQAEEMRAVYLDALKKAREQAGEPPFEIGYIQHNVLRDGKVVGSHKTQPGV
jgi:hypothetical protein